MKTIIIEALSALVGGGQTYLINLLENIPAQWNQHYKIIAIFPKCLKDHIPQSSVYEIITPPFDTSKMLQRIFWHKLYLKDLVYQLNCDVLFSPGGYLPMKVPSTVRTAVAFRNMLPFDDVERRRFDHGYIRYRLWLLKYIQGSSIRDSDLVIFISNYAKAAIDRVIPERRGTSVVIPHGLSDDFRQKSPTRPERLHDIEYVLYVSILFNYKAQLEVIESWYKLRQARLTREKLVLVGPEYKPYSKKVRQLIDLLGLNEEVILTGPVPYSELPSYYQHAKINLFASSCENCPNILLEALAGGKPVLCSNYPPMPEFGGDAVEYFDPYNTDELKELLLKYLDNEELCLKMGQKAFDRSLQFDWKESALKTWNALADLAQS